MISSFCSIHFSFFAVASYVSFVFCAHNCEVKRDANEVAVGSYLRIRATHSLNKEDSRAHALSHSGDINKIQSKKMMKKESISNFVFQVDGFVCIKCIYLRECCFTFV